MNFHYYFLIQDILGILLAALGLKLGIIYFMRILKHGVTLKYISCLIGNMMFVLSGLNFMFSEWSLKTWLISLTFLMVAWLSGRMVYRKPLNNES